MSRDRSCSPPCDAPAARRAPWLLAIALLAAGPLLAAQVADPSGSTPAAAAPATAASASAPALDLLAPRSFLFTSTTEVPAHAAADGAVELWIPVPQSNGYQDVALLGWGLQDPQPVWLPDGFVLESTRDEVSGNAMLHLHLPRVEHPAFSVTLRARVVRRGTAPEGRPDGSGRQDLPRSLAPDRLVPLDGKIGEIARGLPAATNPDALGRELFEEVRQRMTYDKTTPGWGNGDALRACDVGKGNCTDFHALFIGLARARGLPARFSIGYSLPETRADGQPLAGYHCWAEFHTDAHGWVPVDASEADKHPERAESYFGRLTTNRIALTSGRDVMLVPPQHGAPLNYFLKPYAEREGVALEGLTQVVSILDV